MYVSCQFRRLHCIAPAVSTKAVIDDRTFKGPEDQVHKALVDVIDYDKAAGHDTNPEKMTLTATTRKLRIEITKWVFGELSPKVVLAQKLVGDVITVHKNGAKELVGERLQYAIRTAARVKSLQCSNSTKACAVRSVAIPRLLPSTLWAKPLESGLKKMRTQLVATVIGKARSLRCPEVVISICTDPLKMDPQSLVMATTLLNARRMMLKSERRRSDFINDARAAVARFQPGAKLSIPVGPVKGVLDVCSKWTSRTNVSYRDLTLIPLHGPPCNLLSSTKKQLKDFLREMARQSIWADLAEQMVGPNPRRKDLCGFPSLVNVQATMAIAKLKR